MPSRRDLISMTPAEVHAYLAGRRRIILVSNGPDGLPHPMPMNYALDERGRVLITTFRKSQKVRNLERDPRAALLAESGERYAELKSVVLYCDVEIIDDPALVGTLMRGINADEKSAGSISAEMGDQMRASLAKRVVLRFAPFRVISWDHGKLGGFY